MNIKELVGLKNSEKLEAVLNTLTHENPNYKAVVLVSDNEGKNIMELIIPFTSVVKSQDYIDNELPSLGLKGIMLKINEEERKNYNATYTINGIYGQVVFTKFFPNRTKDEMLSFGMIMDLTSTVNPNDKSNYFNMIITTDINNCIFNTEKVINGLPQGFNEDRYFNMALLRDIQTLKPQFNNCDFSHEIERHTQNCNSNGRPIK